MICEIIVGQETMSKGYILGMIASAITEAIKVGHQDPDSTLSAASTTLLTEILAQVLKQMQEEINENECSE